MTNITTLSIETKLVKSLGEKVSVTAICVLTIEVLNQGVVVVYFRSTDVCALKIASSMVNSDIISSKLSDATMIFPVLVASGASRVIRHLEENGRIVLVAPPTFSVWPHKSLNGIARVFSTPVYERSKIG